MNTAVNTYFRFRYAWNRTAYEKWILQ